MHVSAERGLYLDIHTQIKNTLQHTQKTLKIGFQLTFFPLNDERESNKKMFVGIQINSVEIN